MKKWILALPLMMSASHAYSDAIVQSAVYYKGEQPIGIAGDVVDCFVEVEYHDVDASVELRALLADPHGYGDLVGFGPSAADYDESSAGYVFTADDDHDRVQSLFLKSSAPGSSEALRLAILDGSHLDELACNAMSRLQGDTLAYVEEKFEHFDDYVEDDGHGDDHGNH